MKAFQRFGSWLTGVVGVIAFFAVVYGFIWFFFGVTTVTSTCDNTPVVSKVYINNDYAGETPLHIRLGMGNHIIKVEPPAGYRADHLHLEFWSLGRGVNYPETFSRIEYKVTLHSPANRPGNFTAMDGAGNPIGACDGVVCIIPLPSPGNYRVKMERICRPNNLGGQTCNGGDDMVKDFFVSSDQPTFEYTWSL